MSREEINNIIQTILQSYNAKKIALFGSYARGDNKKESDIDILVDLPDELDLFDIAGIKADLEEKLNKSVDLVMYDSIYPSLKKAILKEQQVLYERI